MNRIKINKLRKWRFIIFISIWSIFGLYFFGNKLLEKNNRNYQTQLFKASNSKIIETPSLFDYYKFQLVYPSKNKNEFDDYDRVLAKVINVEKEEVEFAFSYDNNHNSHLDSSYLISVFNSDNIELDTVKIDKSDLMNINQNIVHEIYLNGRRTQITQIIYIKRRNVPHFHMFSQTKDYLALRNYGKSGTVTHVFDVNEDPIDIDNLPMFISNGGIMKFSTAIINKNREFTIQGNSPHSEKWINRCYYRNKKLDCYQE